MSERKAATAWWNGKKHWGCTYDQVSSPGLWGFSRCSNKAKHDLDADGNPTRCGIHCESGIAKRNAKREAEYQKYRAKIDRNATVRELERDAKKLIRSIAEGHNDPRTACTEWLNRYEATLPKEEAK